MTEFRVTPFGEAAVLVHTSTPDVAQALAASLRLGPPPGFVAAVPGLESLLIEFDPLEITADGVWSALAALDPPERNSQPARVRTIPVLYGGDGGPDLDAVAARTGLAADEVIARHAAAELRVLFCGFAPGFAYLGDLPPELHVPRLATPRTRTPRGSVAIAGRLTGVYPAELPGGWLVIGRTPVDLFDPTRDSPAYLQPGDQVRFEAIAADDWARYAGAADDW